MGTRRDFFRTAFAFAWSGTLISHAFLVNSHASQNPIIIPKGTPRTDLQNRNPKGLDTTQLDITPLEQFGAMGLDSHGVDLNTWRLHVRGEVETELGLTYEELHALPKVERAVLMICPGFFANHGLWTGISVGNLLRLAKANSNANYVTFRGPEGNYAKVMRIPMEEIESNRAFLAYGVNNATLPQKHGFPLRLVAEGYYGYEWVKYVDSITVDIVK